MLISMIGFLRNRKADMMAWTALLVIFLALPLASLTVDIVRGLYVRTHLQTASDAACQAAADALDVATFRNTGQRRINTGLGRAQAGTVFAATLQDAGRVGYTPALAVGFPSATVAFCRATASIRRFLPLTPSMTAIVETTSEMRTQVQGP
jgi:hypothetical protein